MNWRMFSVFLLALLLVASGNASSQNQETGKITGKLLTKGGEPMNGGLVYFLSASGPVPAPERYWKVPDYIFEINENGTFSAELPEGAYYLGAIKMKSGETEYGPPQVGDFFYRSLDKKGNPKLLVVKKGKTLNLGAISKAVPFKGLVAEAKVSGITGRVLDSGGKPVAGMLVFAYWSQEMKGRPVFASYRTGADGIYLLRVHEGGSYFLQVRDHYGGGQPETGSLMGAFGREVPEPIAVTTGEITKGKDITVVEFKGRGQQEEQQ